jgi:hypothetical protein
MDSSDRRSAPLPRSILAGQDERIFEVLPETVRDNLRRPSSENALVWNLLYPLAQPDIELTRLLGLRPLWGTLAARHSTDRLVPYFWGFSIGGERLTGLSEALDAVDGPGPQTEVDVFLAGESNLVLIEAKHLSGLGRCSRYANQRCPEVNVAQVPEGETCRYWEAGEAEFARYLELGDRPAPEGGAPACFAHYQLARTLVLGQALASRLDLRPHLWLVVPRNRWPGLQGAWLDFCERVREEAVWRNLRVLAWESVQRIGRDDRRQAAST